MLKFKVRPIALIGLVVTASSLFFSSFAQDIPDFRKRNLTVTVLDGSNPVSGVEVKVSQVRHHFGFGGAMAYWPMDSVMTAEKFKKEVPNHAQLKDKYGKAFAKYFQWITPENEQKWGDVQYVRGADNYYKGDSLVAFAKRNDIKVRGHNLFWNEKFDWIPDWADTIAYKAWSGTPAYFDTGKAIIDQRTEECLKHFKGKCAHWDVINELVHGQVENILGKSVNGTIGTLKALTNMSDADIYERILKKADEHDKDALFCLNDYNMVTRWSRTDAIPDKYAEIAKTLISKGCRIDIIGCEGHFGTDFKEGFTAATLKDNIDYIANKIPDAEIWITELDFEGTTNLDQAATWIESIMDVAFKHPRVGGVVLWTPWEGNRWREALKSFVVDSNMTETPMGKKWLEKINGWTTNETKTTGADGKVSVNGVHGKYKITFEKDGIATDTTVYLAPGSGALAITIPVAKTGIRMNRTSKGNYNRKILVNKSAIEFNLPDAEQGQLFIKSYSVSGKLIAKVPVSFRNGECRIQNMSKGCYIYKIGTESRNYHTTVGMNID